MLGSLNEFIDSNYKEPNYPAVDPEASEEDVAAVNKYSRKKMLEERSRKRSRVGMSEYIPSDKKYIFMASSQTGHYKSTRQTKHLQPEESYITGRKKVS